jgi:hypothetical protein
MRERENSIGETWFWKILLLFIQIFWQDWTLKELEYLTYTKACYLFNSHRNASDIPKVCLSFQTRNCTSAGQSYFNEADSNNFERHGKADGSSTWTWSVVPCPYWNIQHQLRFSDRFRPILSLGRQILSSPARIYTRK